MYSNNYGKKSLFSSQTFHSYQADVIERLKGEIETLSLEELKSEKKKKAMIAGATRTVPSVDWTKIEMIKKEERTQRSDDGVWGPRTYKVTVCTFEAPYTGDQVLFTISPNQRRLSDDEVDVNYNGTIRFELTASENTEQNKADLKRAQDNIDFNLGYLQNDITGYNASLEETVNNLLERRIAELDKHSSQAESFGVPIRSNLSNG